MRSLGSEPQVVRRANTHCASPSTTENGRRTHGERPLRHRRQFEIAEELRRRAENLPGDHPIATRQ